MFPRTLIGIGLLLAGCGGVVPDQETLGTDTEALEPPGWKLNPTMQGPILKPRLPEVVQLPHVPAMAQPRVTAADFTHLPAVLPPTTDVEIDLGVPVARPGDYLVLKVHGAPPDAQLIAVQDEYVAPEYQFCGTAVTKADGTAMMVCRIAPERAERQVMVRLYMDRIADDRMLVTRRIPVVPPEIQTQAAWVDGQVVAAVWGKGRPGGKVEVLITNQHGELLHDGIVGVDALGVWHHRATMPIGTLPGRCDVAARPLGTGAWTTGWFDVVGQTRAWAVHEKLAMVGTGFIPGDQVGIAFYRPDGRLAAPVTTATTWHGVVMAVTPAAYTLQPGMWTLRTYYHDIVGLDQFADVQFMTHTTPDMDR